mgnify:FL=1
MNKILTANGWFQSIWDVHLWTEVMLKAKQYGVDVINEPAGEPVVVKANHGRWLVYCPCSGAEYAWEEGFYICLSCFNAHLKQHIGKSSFPENRREIETIISQRPLPNRNWVPGETIAQLVRENLEYHDSVPEEFSWLM